MSDNINPNHTNQQATENPVVNNQNSEQNYQNQSLNSSNNQTNDQPVSQQKNYSRFGLFDILFTSDCRAKD